MAITIKTIDQLLSGNIQDTSPVMFGLGTDIFKTTWGQMKSQIVGQGITDLSYNLTEYTSVVDASSESLFLSNVNITIAEGEIRFLKFKYINTNGGLGENTYLVPLGQGTYSPLSATISFSDLILLNREETTVESTDANTVTYTVTSLTELNNSDPSLDFTNTDFIYFVEIDGSLYRFTGTNGLYGLNNLQMQMTDLQLVSGAETFVFDDYLNITSDNAVQNKVITNEFDRIKYKYFELTSSLTTLQDFLDTNYRFLNKNINTTLSIILSGDVPEDYNCEGVSLLDTITVSSLSGITLDAPFGTTVGQGEFFRIRRTGLTSFSLEIVKDFGSLGVTSVNGEAGDVTLNADDIPETATRKYATGNELRSGDNISLLINDESYLKTVESTNIEAEAVTNSKLANMIAGTIKGRLSTNGTPEDLTAEQVRSILNINQKYQRVNVSTSRNFLASDNGNTLIITGTVTLTFSGVLPEDFNFNFKVKIGGSLTISNGDKTLLDTTETAQTQIVAEASTFGTVYQFDTNTFIVEGI